MAIANPRIHIICGICGCNKELSFSIEKDFIIENECEDNEVKHDGVIVRCDNCSSITELGEVIRYKGKEEG